MFSRRERQLITDLYPVVSNFTQIGDFGNLTDPEIGVRDYLKRVQDNLPQSSGLVVLALL
jgi:hypothetical protein